MSATNKGTWLGGLMGQKTTSDGFAKPEKAGSSPAVGKASQVWGSLSGVIVIVLTRIRGSNLLRNLLS